MSCLFEDQFEDRRIDSDEDTEFIMSVDGTDFFIQEPRKFSSDWFSHKNISACVRYEVALDIPTGRIVWINGPFPPGLT